MDFLSQLFGGLQMLTKIKNKTTRILFAIAVTLLMAGAPVAVSSVSAAGGSGGGGGSTVTGGG